MSDLDQVRALMNTTLWIFTGLSFFLLALVIGLMVALDRATGHIRAAADALAQAQAELLDMQEARDFARRELAELRGELRRGGAGTFQPD